MRDVILGLSAIALGTVGFVAAGCSSSTSSPPASSPDGGGAASDASSGEKPGEKKGPPEGYTFGGDRPVPVMHVPDSYDPTKPAPLVIVLHGYSANAAQQNIFFNLTPTSDKEGFILVAPDGTMDKDGNRFWNATDNCCNFYGSAVDDVAYVTGLVDEIATYYAIDPKRVFLVGHSNGGAMSFRLGCDRADKFAAIVDLAGPFFVDASKCKPSQPVGLLHLHGTSDDTVSYEPETSGLLRNPGAVATTAAWASHNGCAPTPDKSSPALDIDQAVAGAETDVSKFTGCSQNGEVVLWTMKGSSHVPLNLTRELPSMIYSFLAAHAKP